VGYIQDKKSVREFVGISRKNMGCTQTFLWKIDSGEPGDDDDFFDWYAAKKGLNI
jgi:hypothetical protein